MRLPVFLSFPILPPSCPVLLFDGTKTGINFAFAQSKFLSLFLRFAFFLSPFSPLSRSLAPPITHSLSLSFSLSPPPPSPPISHTFHSTYSQPPLIWNKVTDSVNSVNFTNFVWNPGTSKENPRSRTFKVVCDCLYEYSLPRHLKCLRTWFWGVAGRKIVLTYTNEWSHFVVYLWA